MRNPALADLEVLVGSWRMHLSHASFLDEGATMGGRLVVDWFDDAFLVQRSAFDLSGGPPVSVSVIGRNESVDHYEVLYHDDRGVSRVFAMTFAGGTWTMSRADPGFHQRFDATVESDDVIRGAWSRSHDDGATWIHDFDLVYTRE